ncbi:MAG TPA: hypothetical protein PLN48_06065 [Lachnospiraceae bacterium]|nr:hypothetical protein [Lachnospiraceae bacterium]
MNKSVRICAWIAVLFAVSGAILLFPIGTALLNVLFILIKICMVLGLILFLFSADARRPGFILWTIASLFAVLMTILKWSMDGSRVFLYIVSIIADIGFPVLLFSMGRKDKA